MNKELKTICTKPKTNKLFVLLLLVFLGQSAYMSYVKERTDKKYESLIQIKSLNIIYQDITLIFEKKNSHNSFDKIVQNSKQFDAIMELLSSHADEDEKLHNSEFHTIYQKLYNDYQQSKTYIEQYKSWNSLTINSTRLIYDMHEHINTLIMASDFNKQEKVLVQLLDKITYMVALINYDGISELKSLKKEMRTLEELVFSDEKLSKSIKQFYKHIDLVVEGYETMQALRVENKNLNIKATIDELHKSLLDNFKRQDRNNYINIYVLNFFVIMLLIFLFFTNKKESKLHHEVCILNNELESNIKELENLNNSMIELLDKLDKNVISSTTDARGIITYASEAFCKISGYTRDEIIGKPHNIVRNPEMSKEIYKDMWESIQKGQEWKGEVKNSTKNNGYYWVDVTISPKFDADGNITGYSAIRHDITAKKELEKLTHSLEDQVRIRTQELQEMMKKVERLSITDELTHLYNRRYYAQILDTEIRRAERNKKLFNYLLLDIDNFKSYNDNYGHQFGDFALQEVAKAFTSVLHRPSDFVFRMGGEEFLIIFTSDDQEQAIKFSQKIISTVSALKIDHLGNPPSNVLTVSGGIVSFSPAVGNISEHDLYKKADELLYLAKDEGRNRIKSYRFS